ncbi:MAG: hypothetical protein OFPI_14260 [Osedax symbiont Rs2]|nr:MAG: hypothetical protein OFPI_14260 [Osedax symbiont Rs2]
MLDLIKIFCKTVELGSFSKTAQVLKMAPSSIARNIDALERQLKVTLFKRSTRSLTLTDQGESFYTGAEHLLLQSEQLIAKTRNQQQSPQGLIKISVFESFGRLFLSRYMNEFLSLYPRLKIELNFDNHNVDLSRDAIDLAIRIGHPQDSSLKARKLLTNTTSICASPGYWQQQLVPQTPAELAEHNCLLLNPIRQRSYWYFSRAGKASKILIDGNLSSRGGSALLAAALDGLGVVQLSSWLIDPYIESGQLIPVLQQWQPSLSAQGSGEIFALYHSDSLSQRLSKTWRAITYRFPGRKAREQQTTLYF